MVERLLTVRSAVQVVVAARPLDAAWSRLDGLPAAEHAELKPAVGFYPRPSLRVDFVAPRNATEEYIARIWKELLARGVRVGKDRIQKLMKRHGIKARGKRRYVVTTDSRHNLPIAANLLDRNFQPEQPNAV